MIEKITDQNLERYDSRLKEWCDRKFFEKGNYGKYQTTEESGAVAFYPAPNTPLEGKVKFSFTETMPANGDKGPENPSTITGVSSLQVSRTNKNLLSLPYHTTPGVRNGITWTVNSDGSITATGTAGTGGSYFYIAGSTAKVHLTASKTYFLSGTPTVNNWKTYLVVMDNSASNSYYTADLGSGGTFVPNNDQLLCFARIAAGETVDNYTFRPQIEEGTEATSFEPIQRSQVTINLGSTYYGGELDLATGVMTVTHKSIVYTDTPVNWYNDFIQVDDYYAGYSNSYRAAPKNSQGAGAVSSHFNYGTKGNNKRFYITDAGDVCLVTEYSSKNSLNAWLTSQYENGTPVTIVYEIATPIIVQLTPLQLTTLVQTDKYTPRLNTVYTDADNVQISYLKSPIRDEYEKTQAILSLGGNS